MAEALRALVKFYRTGEDADRVAYDIAWVHDKDSPVDTINGFIEVYMDPRGIKGSWEALVYYVNRHKTENIRKIAANAQWFEDRMPWAPEIPQRRGPRSHRQRHRRRRRSRRVGADDAGRHQSAERPGDPRDAWQQVGVAVERQRGVRRVDRSGVPARVRVDADEEAARAEKWSAVAGELTTELHEVIGHGSGKVGEQLKGAPQNALKEQYSALEEARADLVALYFVADPQDGGARDHRRRQTTTRSCSPSTRATRAMPSRNSGASAKAPRSKKTTCATAR